VVTVEQEAVGDPIIGFQAGPGEDHHRSPMVDLGEGATGAGRKAQGG